MLLPNFKYQRKNEFFLKASAHKGSIERRRRILTENMVMMKVTMKFQMFLNRSETMLNLSMDRFALIVPEKHYTRREGKKETEA